jgi:magnesium-protoporphyrin IX monomethyl ester (oxidative) cyclase
VFLGEAEVSLPQYLQSLDTGGIEAATSDGIAFMQDGEVRIHPQSDHPDLNALPFPARDLVPFEEYVRRSGGRWIRPGVRIASIISSRGCPYRCTYCSAFRVTGRKYRTRSPESVLEEIAELVERYRIKVIAFEDDNLTADRARAITIFEGIQDKFPELQWVTPNGVSIRNLDRDLLGLMKRSGCRTINLAFESGDLEILHNSMKKYMDPEEGRQVRGWCREVGIHVNGMFILGMPGETVDSMRRTRDYALSLDLDGIGIFIATPFPGTELYDTCKAQGYLDLEYARGDALFQADPEVLHRPLIETPYLKREELMAFYDQFERDFMRNYYARRPSARLRKFARLALQRLGWGR